MEKKLKIQSTVQPVEKVSEQTWFYMFVRPIRQQMQSSQLRLIQSTKN